MTWPYDPRAGLYVGGDDFGLPASGPPRLSRDDLETLIQFEHPAKLLSVAELPGAAGLSDVALAAAYTTDAATVWSIREDFRRRARDAAEDLLLDEGVREAVRRLPVSAGGVVVALGDSITDDYQSWAEILRQCVALARADDGIVVINAGVSGDTTADVLGRLYGALETAPDLVMTMLGTNDCQRHGPDRELRVSPAESARNLAAIASWLQAAGARQAWITPPPVLEDALARAVGSRPFEIRDADVRTVARLVHGLDGSVVDLHEVLGTPPAAELLMADGVHPSLAGQKAIAAALLSELARDRSPSQAGSPSAATASSPAPQGASGPSRRR